MPVRIVATAVCVSVLAAAGFAQGPTAVSSRRLPFGVPLVGVPLTVYNIQRAMAELAWAARVPIGYEAPFDEPWQPAPVAQGIETGGKTLEQVLNTIVIRQPVYEWSQGDGVIHLRPVDAATDPDSVLNRAVEAFALRDGTLSDAMLELHYTLRPELRGGGVAGSGPSPTSSGLRRFSVTVANATVMGVLDAIVRAHGESSWAVTYERDDLFVLRFHLAFNTFDGWGTRM